MLKNCLISAILLVGLVVGQKPDPDAPQRKTDAPPTADCGKSGIDLVLVIDVSGSVTRPNFDQMMDAVRSFAKGLPVGTNDDESHVGVTTFSSSATTNFGLDDHLNNQDLDQALSQVPYTEGGTNITSGMEEALKIFAGDGNRPDVPDVMVVITDGQDSSDVRTANQEATAKGITIFAVGVGNSNNLDLNQLEIVAGTSDNVFVSTNFTFLDSTLKDKVCQGIVEQVQQQTTARPPNPPIGKDEPEKTTPSNECQGINEIFDSCGGCEAACGNFSLTCTRECNKEKARCRCQTGFVRHSNGSCVTPDTCCDRSEVFDACGGCEEKCGRRRLDCIDGCDFSHARCRCRRGHARDESGMCVTRDFCFGNQLIQNTNQVCGINEVRRCSTSCEGTCDSRQPECIFNAPIRRNCRFPRCECPVENGFVRDHFGRCFHSSLCPRQPSFSGQQNPSSNSNDNSNRPQNPSSDNQRPSDSGNSGSNGQPSKTIIIIKPEFSSDNHPSHSSDQQQQQPPQNSGTGNQNSGSGDQQSGSGGNQKPDGDNSGQRPLPDELDSGNTGGQGSTGQRPSDGSTGGKRPSNRPSKIIIIPGTDNSDNNSPDQGPSGMGGSNSDTSNEEERIRQKACRHVECGPRFHCELQCMRGICQPACMLDRQ